MVTRIIKESPRDQKFNAVITEMQTTHECGVFSEFWRNFIYEMIDDGLSHGDIVLSLLINKSISESRIGSGI